MFNLIKRFFNLNKTMASTEMKPINKANTVEVLEALAAYKKQNPAKYEAKKAALFAKYGLNESDLTLEIQDESDKQLEELKKKAKKVNIV